ncbi:hypothetical protein [Deferrisoma camini]|uniref:hypothetical protein n=1 Tax=Deferrisoma camini TaxID=1035120 RepID=UPI00046CACA4|nr:hypothetical protein [Deferrisoma camini]
MATALNRVQVTWSSANTVSVAASGTQTSDDATLSSTAWAREVRVKAVTGAAGASGDTLELYWEGRGDPDGDSTNDYETDGTYLGTMDVGAASSTYVRSFGLYGLAQYGRLKVVSNASDACTVSAEITEITA